jgi:hypothetical protein
MMAMCPFPRRQECPPTGPGKIQAAVNHHAGNGKLGELKKALWRAWLILTGCSLLGVMALWIVPQATLLAISATLQAEHESCLLCGMTRAFLSLSRGNLQEAIALNALSPVLFCAIIINFIILLCYIIGLADRAVRNRRNPTQIENRDIS